MAEIAPWLQPANPTGNFLEAYRTSASLAEARARAQQEAALATQRMMQEAAMQQSQIGLAHEKLAQDAEQTQVALQMRQQEHERESMVEQQKMEIAKSYHEQQTALRKQQLDEAAKANEAKMKQWAETSAAKMQYSREMEGIANNPDLTPDQKQQARSEATFKYGPMMVGASGMGSMLGTAQKMAPPPSPSWVGAEEGGAPGHFLQGGRAYVPPQQREDPLARSARIVAADEYKKLTTEKFNLEKTLAETNDKDIRANLEDQITKKTRRQRMLQQELGIIPRDAAPAAAAHAPGGFKVLRIREKGQPWEDAKSFTNPVDEPPAGMAFLNQPGGRPLTEEDFPPPE